MFETTVTSRRAGRIAFGVVLLCGAGVVLLRVADQAQFGTDKGLAVKWIMLATWAGAFLASFVVSRMRVTSTALRTASLVVPSVGIALMLPLFIHLMFMITSNAAAFDRWVALSIVSVGFAHVVFAVLAGLRAWQLSSGRRAISVWSVYCFVVFASCVPWGMFILPPLLTAVTGLPIIALLDYQETLATREREADRIGEIPAAIARWRAIG